MNKKLKIFLAAFYVGLLVYILLYVYMEPVRVYVNESQEGIAIWAERYKSWMYVIALFVCFLGSASVVFPVPFPVVMFFFGEALLLQYGGVGGGIEVASGESMFWAEMLGIAFAGGLGCALGEVTGYAMGMGAKAVMEGTESKALNRFNALAEAIQKNERSAPWLVFLFALTPLPDDILMIPLGMAKYPWYKCILPGWLGKNVTTIFYVFWPVLINLSLIGGGYAHSSDPLVVNSGIIVEAVMMGVSILVIAIILSVDWETKFKGKSFAGTTGAGPREENDEEKPETAERPKAQDKQA